MIKKNRILIACVICITLTLLAIAGTLAYLKNVDEVTNTFEIGNINILLTESEYPGNFDSQVTNLLPNAEVEKNPQIRNIGLHSSFVFLKVTVPVENVTVAEADGTLGEQTAQEIFFLKRSGTDKYTNENSFNDGWVELISLEEGKDYTGTTRTYVFGYNKAISPSEITNTLFDKIQFKNVVDYSYFSAETQNIMVEAFGIQTDYLPNINEKTGLTEEQLTEIYKILNE